MLQGSTATWKLYSALLCVTVARHFPLFCGHNLGFCGSSMFWWEGTAHAAKPQNSARGRPDCAALSAAAVAAAWAAAQAAVSLLGCACCTALLASDAPIAAASAAALASAAAALASFSCAAHFSADCACTHIHKGFPPNCKPALLDHGLNSHKQPAHAEKGAVKAALTGDRGTDLEQFCSSRVGVFRVLGLFQHVCSLNLCALGEEQG